MSTPKIPVVKTPKLFDEAINEFNQRLAVELPWLTYLFGQSEPMSRKLGNGGVQVFPSVYAGENHENEYQSVLPDELFGSGSEIRGYSFFEIGSPTYDSFKITSPVNYLDADVGIVFWFNLKKVLSDPEEYRNWDLAIFNIIEAIKKCSQSFSGVVTPLNYTKKASEIYKEYSLKEVDQQFLLHPFAGVRVNCDMRILQKRLC